MASKKLTNVQLDELFQKYEEHKADEAKAKAEADKLKASIKAELNRRKVKQYDGDGWRASISDVVTHKFDLASFRVDHPKMHAKYLSDSVITRFNLNSIKGAQ